MKSEYKKVTFTFGKIEAGWLDLYVNCDSKKLKVRTSAVYDPYEEIKCWFEKIIKNEFPAQITIDEEGRYKSFKIESVTDVLLKYSIYDEENCNGEFLVNTIINKKELVGNYYHSFKAFVINEYDPDEWEFDLDGNNLKTIDFTNIEKYLFNSQI